MKRTFEELDERYNIKRFVFMWLEDYEPNMGFHVLGHLIEHIVNTEINMYQTVIRCEHEKDYTTCPKCQPTAKRLPCGNSCEPEVIIQDDGSKLYIACC